MRRLQLTIGKKLVAACLAFALLPMAVIGLVTWNAVTKLENSAAEEFTTVATSIGDKIDRCMFERYGDAQAFGVNQVIQNRKQWYKPSAENPIVAAMNKYVELYGIYQLTLLVDTNGKLIAVNNRDALKVGIDTAYLYEKNFSQEPWFVEAIAGKFHTSKDSTITGTVVQDFYSDEDVKKVYRGEGLAIGFAAPVFGEKGEVIGVWKNVAQFSVVEEIVYSYYKDLQGRGLSTAVISLVDAKGNGLVDCDSTSKGTTDVVRD